MLFDPILGVFSHDLAVDLGTANTLVYAKDRGVILSEPSVVAIQENTKEVIAVGKKAKRMLGRTPGNIKATQPMRDGVIADFEVAEVMLKYFIRKVHNRNRLVRPRVIVCVPSGITQVERNAVVSSVYQVGARKVFLVTEPMAAAIGANLPVTSASGNMIVDVGGGTTEVAILSLSGTVYCKSARVGGNEMDVAIMQYMRKQYNLAIGESSAEVIKISIGSAYPLPETATMGIRGKDVVSGTPRVVDITDEEIRNALAEPVNTIVNAVRISLEKTPPELAADIADRGIILAGGGSLIKGLDERLRRETHLPVIYADDPLSCVVLGAGKLLGDMELLRSVALE